MIQPSAHLAKGTLQNTEIYKHSARIEGFPAGMSQNPVIVAVKTLAFTMKIGQEMGGGEVRLYSGFIHIQYSTPMVLPIQETIDTIESDMKKRLSQFTASLPVLEKTGYSDPEITDLVYDSRQVTGGSLFFALSGLHTDGAAFIGSAIEKGARAVIHGTPLLVYHPDVVYLRVADPRFSMSAVASMFYDHPSKDLVVIGVTGTEGKSTTVSLIFQLLRLCGKKVGFISTVDYCVNEEVLPNPEHQTTPEALTIHARLAEMRDNGLEYAVVESSSHGLSAKTNRLGDVLFDAVVMTNVTHEHLEFHGTIEQYKYDKANLFRSLDNHDHVKKGRPIPSFGVVNEEDPASAYFREVTQKPIFGYSTAAKVPVGLSASAIAPDSGGVSFTMSENGSPRHSVRINLPGAFNVYNTMAALIIVSRLTGTEVSSLVPLLRELIPVRGRMTVIDEGQPFEVLVDYAHTPSSFMAVFPSLRKRVKGRIISLFGSGGERDILKRSEQGRIADEYSDIVILADEDPRGEDPVALLEMIASGCRRKTREESLFIIPDRKLAIRKAFFLARPGDLVILLGKGHENSIIYKDHTDPYDEISEAQKALHELSYGGKK